MMMFDLPLKKKEKDKYKNKDIVSFFKSKEPGGK